MKPAPFDYTTASTSADVASELAASTGTKLVAGAQSLGPMLNLRLARPSRLIDIGLQPELREVHETADSVEIGAAMTHAEIEDGDVPDPTGGWLQEAASNIAHRAVRNRGTLGGSLAHADPAADWVIVMTGLGASVLIDGTSGSRRVPMDAFITGPFETALRPGELIRAVSIPRPDSNAQWSYWKFVRQVGEFAKASATVLVDPGNGPPRIAIGALGRQPLIFATETSEKLLASETTAAAALAEALPERSAIDLALHAAALNNALAKVLEKADEKGDASG